MEIKRHWYYILKNSNDINDVVVVLEVYTGQIIYRYYTNPETNQYDSKGISTNRVLHPKTFKVYYKEHPTLNVLYSS